MVSHGLQLHESWFRKKWKPWTLPFISQGYPLGTQPASGWLWVFSLERNLCWEMGTPPGDWMEKSSLIANINENNLLHRDVILLTQARAAQAFNAVRWIPRNGLWCSLAAGLGLGNSLWQLRVSKTRAEQDAASITATRKHIHLPAGLPFCARCCYFAGLWPQNYP